MLQHCSSIYTHIYKVYIGELINYISNIFNMVILNSDQKYNRLKSFTFFLKKIMTATYNCVGIYCILMVLLCCL